jgi:hypothetical protein
MRNELIPPKFIGWTHDVSPHEVYGMTPQTKHIINFSW